MTPGPACIALVKRFEGLSLEAYPDPASGGEPYTVGWGSTGPDIGPHTVWTQAQADARLQDDLGKFADALDLLLGAAKTTANQFDALVDFSYNLGTAALANSTLLRMHIAGNYAGAAEQFGRWVRANGKVMPGLVKRRAAERALYLGQQP